MNTNKLKITDLMVGDWVACQINSIEFKYVRIASINKTTMNGIPSDFIEFNKVMVDMLNGNYYQLDVASIYPIPLTPEILEKNGFEKVDNIYPFPTFRSDDKENYLCITIGFPEGDKTKRKRPFIEIDGVNIYIGHLIINFVHQLQNALKLCGIDKDIIV